MSYKQPLALDTCAISNWDFMNWLRPYHKEKVISPIVYAEFSAHMLKKKKGHRDVQKLLYTAGIEVTPFGVQHAERAADIIYETGDAYKCDKCNKTNWNDCLITAHVPLPPYLFITENVKDFYSLLDKNRIKTPNNLMYPDRMTDE
jgi:predicted nucleic acid-binding protein